MNYEKYYSEKVKGMRPSIIRELLKKYVGKKGLISLAAGNPSPETFPTRIIKKLADEVLEKYGKDALQYGPTPGYSGLIEQIKNFIEERYKIDSSKVGVLITSGAQQVLDLTGMTFLNPGDVVIIEAPTYVAAIDAFAQYGPEFVQVPVDEEGMRVDVLEDKLKKLKAEGKNVKFVYTIPTFQNPGGVTMSEERRKYLLELANKYDFLIIEDDPYHELNYSDKEPPLPIKHWDSEGRVIYSGSFSKILAPGFRVGWIVADPQIIRKFEIVKQRRDLHTSSFCQYIAAEYIKGGYLREHIPKIRAYYKPKLKVMLDALEEYMPEGFEWTKPTGGMFVWVMGPSELNTTSMLEKAVENGVVYVPGEAFYPDRSVKNAMRVDFSYPSEEEIVEGIKRLAKTCKEEGV
ncbi:PLP-dependent aminotransferase family protein [Thermococcus aggregans]|uniref:PLP-dependent aminotransferase family protein n=1 Tax=Thermococcus aggregans TaxID=110163 RepID=A0A9E7SNQ8_THEAG|nr:PLP-dependent aminotransferase family protein [Thermococcus aggregans]USS40047.1 PLP-dependent aminotransferase family protein [Thermococcus aggregans]